MAGLLLISAVAALGALPQPASDTVEVELSVVGTAEVPAQGYRINAFLFRQPPGASEPVDTAAIIRQLEALEMPDRETCLPPNRFGFVGNELATLASEAVEASEETDSAPEGAPAEWRLRAPVPHSGLLPSGAAVESAQAVLSNRRQRPAVIQPVLFECDAAFEQARLAALARSAEEVEPIAQALGMRVAGVTRIASDSQTNSLLVLTTLNHMNNASDPSETVDVQVSLNVTYRLER